MLIRTGLSGRVQPIDAQYMAEPATCCMCSRPPFNPQEVFLNLGVELEFFGFLYLCPSCAVEIGESVSSVPYERHEELRNEYLVQSTIVVEQYQKINYLRGLLDARIDLAGSSKPDSDGTISVPVPTDEQGQDSVDSIIDGLESESTESGKD